MKGPTYDIRPCLIGDVVRLCEAHHAYAGAGSTAVYCFGVFEAPLPRGRWRKSCRRWRRVRFRATRIVAAFAWQPPAAGAALSVCPEVPGGVLALSRMVAVPKADRRLVHISKPLRVIMRRLIDRARWPVLITYSDESAGHTGHVYKCSGWQPERDAKGEPVRRKSPSYENATGQRTSSYSAGKSRAADLVRIGSKVTQRWEHWATTTPLAHMTAAGWERVPIPGKVWRSGKQAYTWVRRDHAPEPFPLAA